jgi:putative oxidoreductase
MSRTNILAAVSSLLTLLFVYASFSKFLRFRVFQHQLHNQVFPYWTEPILSWTVPGIEIAIVVALCLNRTRLIGLWCSLVLMSLFTAYIGLILMHAFSRVPCSCGGVIQLLGWKSHLVFNLFFVALSIIGVIVEKRGIRDLEDRPQLA